MVRSTKKMVGPTENVKGSVPSRLSGPKRRDQLLDIALELFSEYGYIQTSVGDIAKKAGVTKPIIYQHFASKKALYMELLERVGEQLLSEINAATSKAKTPRGQVELGFSAYFQYVSQYESSFYLLFGTGGKRDDEFSEVARKVEETMARAVASLIEAGISSQHRLMLAYGIVGLAESTSRKWLTSRHIDYEDSLPADPDVLARWVGEIAWGGLRGITKD